jgi:hypothetical protein
MIDPRISLQGRAPDLGQTFTNMQNRLNNRETQQQNTQLFDMKMAQGKQQMDDDRDNRRLQSVAEFSATQILPNMDNPQLLANKLQQRIVMMDNDPNMDSTESREVLAQLQSGDVEGVRRIAQESVALFNMRNGNQQQSGTASQRDFQLFQKLTEKAQTTGAPEDIMAAQQFGQQSGFNRPSMQQQQQNAVDKAQSLADIDISKAAAIEQAKQPILIKTEALKNAQARSEKAIDSIVNIRSEIGNLDASIQAIDEGAESGRISNWLPSFRKSTIKLESAAKRLGLNVVTATTFGALSEGELKLAMDVAVPRDLQPQDLKDWLTTRRDARIKLSRELENMAIALGTEGITGAEYLKRQRDNDPLGLGL